MKKTALFRGTPTAIIAAAMLWALSIKGLGKAYYFAVLLPIAAFFFLIVAWFIHLRDDGFFNTTAKRRDSQPIDDGQAALPRDSRPSADPPLSLFAPRDGIVARSGEPQGPRRTIDGGAAGPALFVAAIELAVLSAILYLASGIGASYFR